MRKYKRGAEGLEKILEKKEGGKRIVEEVKVNKSYT